MRVVILIIIIILFSLTVYSTEVNSSNYKSMVLINNGFSKIQSSNYRSYVIVGSGMSGKSSSNNYIVSVLNPTFYEKIQTVSSVGGGFASGLTEDFEILNKDSDGGVTLGDIYRGKLIIRNKEDESFEVKIKISDLTYNEIRDRVFINGNPYETDVILYPGTNEISYTVYTDKLILGDRNFTIFVVAFEVISSKKTEVATLRLKVKEEKFTFANFLNQTFFTRNISFYNKIKGEEKYINVSIKGYHIFYTTLFSFIFLILGMLYRRKWKRKFY